MDFEKFHQAVASAMTAVASGWEVKLGVAAFLSILEFHATIFLVFSLLVIIDLLTKWLALAKPLTETGEILDEIKAIPEAHRRGIISSEKMKTRFAGKIIVYLLIAIAAGAVDSIAASVGGTAHAFSLCVGYLAATELLSVVENLNDAGVSAMADLLATVKKLKTK